MERIKASRGSTTTAVSLALFLLAFTSVTVYLFVKRTWWFPEPINQMGREIDAQFMRTLWITGVVFVLSQLALGWAVFRYRSRGQRASYSHGNNTMEVVWTLITAVVFIGLGVVGQNVWAGFHFVGAAPDAVRIEVNGQQFAWNFRYPGPDGQFGKTDPKLISDSSGNPLGIDPNDPAGKDDLVMPIIAVPVNREIELILHSKDVTHSFFVRELRMKQDLVPGMEIHIHFRPEKIGRYEIACAELCGLGHQRMRSFLDVMSAEDYEKWLREQAELNKE